MAARWVVRLSGRIFERHRAHRSRLCPPLKTASQWSLRHVSFGRPLPLALGSGFAQVAHFIDAPHSS
jgi:hypothetical protein